MSGKRKNKGVVALVAVIVIGATVLLMAVSVSLLGMSELQTGFYYDQANISIQASDACIEEAAFRLKLDHDYTGGSFNVGDNLCGAIITSSGPDDRIINASSTVGDFVTRIYVEAEIYSNAAGNAETINIYRWIEQ